MRDPRAPVLRDAGPGDAQAIAALHADSWRRTYRGAYADAYLDADLVADRLAVWTARLARRDGGTRTVVATSDDHLIGFAHVVFDHDPRWGALLDNLHAAHAHRRRGVGTRLLRLVARAVGDGGLYLWVQEQNVRAQAFYASHGARHVERARITPPGGVPGRLTGTPHKLRLVWDPERLAHLSERGR